MTRGDRTRRRAVSARPRQAVATVVAACLATAACGYRHEALYPEDIKTVAVPIFRNHAYYKGVEFQLTEAIKKQIESRTPYKIADRGGADTIINGEIVQITQKTLSRRREGGLPQDMEFIFVVNFAWKDLRTGRILRERRGMQIDAPYVPAIQVGETQGIGQFRTVGRIADRVVDVMKTDL